MKWLKHLVDSGDDPDIGEAMARFGPYGYYVFFRTLEIMAREFDVQNPGINTFAVAYLRSKYTKKWRCTRDALEFFSSKGRIIIEFGVEGGLEMITLNCPKLKELCDEYTQKLIKGLSGQTPDSHRDNIGIHSVSEEEEDPREEKKGKKRGGESEGRGLFGSGLETQPSPDSVFEIEMTGGGKHPVYQTDIDRWSELYPAVDVPQALRNIIGWLEGHSDKRSATTKGVKARITGWLKRDQDRGGTKAGAGRPPWEVEGEAAREKGRQQRKDWAEKGEDDEKT